MAPNQRSGKTAIFDKRRETNARTQLVDNLEASELYLESHVAGENLSQLL